MTSQQGVSTSSAGNRIQHDSQNDNSIGSVHIANGAGNGSGNGAEWILDTGATDHMTFDRNDLINSKIPKKNGIINANRVCYPVNMAGDVKIYPNLTFQNTLVVPSLSSKLVSVGQLTKDLNCMVHIFPDHCTFQDIQTKRILGRGTRRGGLYYLDEPKIGEALLNKGSDGKETEILVWHKRLGHPSLGYMKKLYPKLFNNYNCDRLVCETCIKAKCHRSSYSSSNNKALAPFDLVHTDVWGPSPMYSKAGYRWYIIFVDDFSRMTWLYLLKTKEEVKENFKIFITMVKTQFGKNIKVIRSDNGTEYINHNIREILHSNGIIHETSCIGTPQQNGITERKNRHILEITRALLIETNVPNIFWDNAITFAIYLMNRTPTQVNNFETPLKYFSAHLKVNSLLNLEQKIFGCTVYVHLQKQFRSKLEPRAEKCIFLGIGQHQKGYKCYSPNTRKFYITMDVVFIEHEPYFKNPQNPIQEGKNANEMSSELSELNFAFLDYTKHYEIATAARSFPSLAYNQQPEDSSLPSSTSLDSALQSHDTSLAQDTHADITDDQTYEDTTEVQRTEIIQSSDDLVSQPDSLHEVSIPEQRFALPPRTNRGKPPKRYVPEDGSSIVKYPIANFTATSHLKEPLKGFVNQISTTTIPTKVEEALSKPEWRNAMNIEMDALKKNNT